MFSLSLSLSLTSDHPFAGTTADSKRPRRSAFARKLARTETTRLRIQLPRSNAERLQSSASTAQATTHSTTPT